MAYAAIGHASLNTISAHKCNGHIDNTNKNNTVVKVAINDRNCDTYLTENDIEDGSRQHIEVSCSNLLNLHLLHMMV